MSIRTLLISLILCLLAPVCLGAFDEDFVSFVWDGGGATLDKNGGGAKKSAWDAGAPEDFFDITNGSATSADATHNDFTDACEVLEGAGDTVKVVAPNANDFSAVTTGTIAFIEFKVTALDGYYFVTELAADEITIDGLTFSGDLSGSSDDCDIWVGGVVGGLATIINEAADLVNANDVNCEVFIKGDETLTSDLTLAAGGGTPSTVLHFLGVDTDWVRIVPTRVAAAGGGTIENNLLDTANMPDITLNANVELHFDVNHVLVDGLYIHGNTAGTMVGSTGNDRQTFTNSVFDNASVADTSYALRSDVTTYVENCDIIRSGGSGDTICFLGDGQSVVNNCRIINNSSSTSSVGIITDQGSIINCLFDSIQGTAIRFAGPSTSIFQTAINCTFWECGIDVQYPNQAHVIAAVFTNNLSSGNDTAIIDNLWTSNRTVFAYYNRLIDFDTISYPSDIVGDVGFQDILGAGSDFVSTGNKNFNLLATSPAKEADPVKRDVGSHPSKDAAGGGGGGGVVGVSWN